MMFTLFYFNLRQSKIEIFFFNSGWYEIKYFSFQAWLFVFQINFRRSCRICSKFFFECLVKSYRKSQFFSQSSELWNRFLQNANKNMHFVLLSKPSKSLRLYCRQYMGLIGGTYINYIHKWNDRALIKVAESFLSDYPIISDLYFHNVINHLMHVHKSMHFYSKKYFTDFNQLNIVTPSNFIYNIRIYIQLIGNVYHLKLINR